MTQSTGLKSNIGNMRGQAGLTQLELSQIVGVTETTISNWEKGRSGLSWIERISKMCDALDCRPSDLIEYGEIESADPIGNGKSKLSDLRDLAGTRERPLRNHSKTG